MSVSETLEKLRLRFENGGLRRDADSVAITRREFAILHYHHQAAEAGADAGSSELSEWRRLGALIGSNTPEPIAPESFKAPGVRAAAERAAGIPPPSRRGFERLAAVLRGELRAVVRDLDDISPEEEARVSEALANGGSWGAYREAITIAEERANAYLARAANSGELPEMIVVEHIEIGAAGWARQRRSIQSVEDELRSRCEARGIEPPPAGSFGSETSTPRGFQVTGLRSDELARKLVEFDRDQAVTMLRHLIAILLGRPWDQSLGRLPSEASGSYCWSKDGESFRDHFGRRRDRA